MCGVGCGDTEYCRRRHSQTQAIPLLVHSRRRQKAPRSTQLPSAHSWRFSFARRPCRRLRSPCVQHGVQQRSVLSVPGRVCCGLSVAVFAGRVVVRCYTQVRGRVRWLVADSVACVARRARWGARSCTVECRAPRAVLSHGARASAVAPSRRWCDRCVSPGICIHRVVYRAVRDIYCDTT